MFMANVKNKFCDVISKTFYWWYLAGVGAYSLESLALESKISPENLSLQIHFMKGMNTCWTTVNNKDKAKQQQNHQKLPCSTKLKIFLNKKLAIFSNKIQKVPTLVNVEKIIHRNLGSEYIIGILQGEVLGSNYDSASHLLSLWP